MGSRHNHHNGKQLAHSSIGGPVASKKYFGYVVGKLLIVFHLLSSGTRFFCKILSLSLIISSYCASMTGHFAPGSVPISCHIISCSVWVTLALNREAVPAAAVIRIMFISKWCFLNRNKRHIVMTAQLMGANSFNSRFSLGFFSLSKLLKEQKATPLIEKDNECVPTCYKVMLYIFSIFCAFFFSK